MNLMFPSTMPPLSKAAESFCDFLSATGYAMSDWTRDPKADVPTARELIKYPLEKFCACMAERHSWTKKDSKALRREVHGKEFLAGVEVSMWPDRLRRCVVWWFDMPLGEIQFVRDHWTGVGPAPMKLLRGSIVSRLN